MCSTETYIKVDYIFVPRHVGVMTDKFYKITIYLRQCIKYSLKTLHKMELFENQIDLIYN